MAKEPSFPSDAPVGATPKEPKPAAQAKPTSQAPSAAAAADSKPADAKPGAESSRKKQIVAGAAIGIGSAAIVAALLYANRNRRGDKA